MQSKPATSFLSDFISFKGKLTVNPLIRIFESFSNIMEMAFLFENSPQGNQKAKGKTERSIANQIKTLTKSFQQGGLLDLICKLDFEAQAIIQSEIAFFNNENIAHVEEGEYTVVGKLVRKILPGDEPLSLLRNTSISLAQKSFLEMIKTSLTTPDMEQAGFELPDVQNEIDHGLLVLPIGIYT